MMKGLAIVVVALSWLSVSAQPKTPLYIQLSGTITDTAGLALSKATIQLTQGADTLTTLSRDDGRFVFPRARSGKFKLLITMKGYISYSHLYNAPEGKWSLNLLSIALRTDYNELDPVTITRVRPITILEDTVSYNVAAFPVRDGSEVEDILKRLPGVEVDVNGNVIVQGKPLRKVLVNGKEFFGNDILLAIQNLPADVVDKLQVIDDYGDKARLSGVKSGDAAKVLNIVLKPDKRNGEFGRAEGGIGTQDKYLGDAFTNAFKDERQMSVLIGISNNSPTGSDRTDNDGLSYSDQWDPRWSGAVSINNGSQAPHSADSSSQTTYYPGETLLQTENNLNSSHNAHTNLDARLTYKPDNYSLLRFTATGALQKSGSQSSGNFTTLQEDSGYTKSSNGQSLNNTRSTGQTFNSNLYYERTSPYSRRRFSVDGGLEYSSTNTVTHSQSSALILLDNVPSPSFLDYLTPDISKTWNTRLNSNLFLPLSQTSFLELGYQVRSTLSMTNIVTQQADSGSAAFVTIDSLSQQVVLHSLTQNIHTAYTGKLSRLAISAGIDAQPGMQKGTVDAKGDVTSYSYFSILPRLQTTWNFDKSHRLSLSYNNQPNLPTLQQLTPFTNLTNPQYPVTGNPNLKPSYTDNLALRYEQSSLRPTQCFGFGVGISYSSTRNTIIQNLTAPRESSQVIQATTFLNAGTTDNLVADYHLNLPAIVNKRFRINISGSVGKAETITMSDNLQYLTQTWTWNQSIHLQLLIPDVIESDLSGNYTLTNTLYPQSTGQTNSFRSASLVFNSRHYFFWKWILNYQLSQPYTSTGDRLVPAPASLTASLQRQFLPHNRATITLAGYNLLNQTAAAGQSSSPTTFTYNRPVLTGRYYLLTFRLKLERFRK
jgi:Outer membrane protein beta-barrel family